MKLKNVQAYPIKDVPDHLVQECVDLGKQVARAICDECVGRDANIILGAVSFAHAVILKYYVSDERAQIERAAKLAAIGLLKNVDVLIAIQESGEEND